MPYNRSAETAAGRSMQEISSSTPESTCRICSGRTRKVFDLQSQRNRILVPVFRCPACNAYFSDGGPVDYQDVDLTDYYLRYADVIRGRYHRVFARLEQLMAPGRLLDIGAGIGFSVEVGRARGWSANGIEPNRALSDYARRQGLEVDTAYLTNDTAGEYDAILIDNVLEHVPDPLSFLQDAARLLAPAGVMIVAVPPMDWLRQALGMSAYVRNWVTRPQLNIFGEVDEHLNIIGRRAMGRLVDRAGLKLLPIRFHHSKAYNNTAFRAAGLDDGYYFITQSKNRQP